MREWVSSNYAIMREGLRMRKCSINVFGASKMSERKRKLDIDGSGSEARKSR